MEASMDQVGTINRDQTPTRLRPITSEELRLHNTESDLWISIQGKVYDATAWVKIHPGGELPLLSLGGQDITDAFIAYHPGTAWSALAALPLVGRLADYAVSDVSRDYRRISAEFSRIGLFDRKGRTTAVSLSVMFLMLGAAVYGVLRSGSAAVHIACATLMGLVWMQAGFMGHDSGHYRTVRSAAANRAMQILTGNCLTGISIGWWKRNHNLHHIACNSLDFDPDVQHIPMFAVSSELFNSLTSFFYERKMTFDGVARAFVSYQHWSFYPVMCVARVNLFMQSIVLLTDRKKKVEGRWAEIAGMVVFWMWFPLLVSCLPGWWEMAAFVAVSFAVTGIQHVQFCLNHFSTSVYVGPPKGNDWFEKQTMGTLDIACPAWMDWFHGGLQFQVEHHLFPRLPRCQLRGVAPVVKELCKKHGLPYSSYSFLEANVRTIATLRTAAMEARNLVWEAIHTHG